MTAENVESFRVDLRGIVGILSHHLYSSPRVYLRELLQNARDAVVAAHALDPATPAGIEITVDTASATLSVLDHGIGLTEQEMREVLATIGASSKREHLEVTRRRFLGQFGIGLLSCFLIADRIEVRSRSSRTADAPTLLWEGHSDGTFTIAPAEQPLDTAGTEVRLQARPDDRDWVQANRVRLLAQRFAALLDLPITIHADGEPAALISCHTPPWRLAAADAEGWCRREFGFYPLAVLPIEVGVAGVSGAAFVADTPGRVGNRRGDSVWSHGMFVAEDNTQLAPDWAYFARLAVEAGDLPLTAARESIQDAPALPAVRRQVGRQIRSGIETFAERDPDGFALFLQVHGKGLLAMAAEDRGMLDLVVRHLRWETNAGPMTLSEALTTHSSVRYARTESDFSTFQAVLAAQGSLLINGSYVYGCEILSLLSRDAGRAGRLGRFDPDRFLAQMTEPTAAEPAARLLREATPVLADLGAELVLRAFEPETVAVLYLPGHATEPENTETEADPWAEFVNEPAEATKRPRTVLNLSSRIVRSLGSIEDPALVREVLVALHTIGMLTAGEHLGENQSRLLNQSLQSLVSAAAGIA
ncbi:HSP90 family protein [Streptomyces sp. AD55]|uniref:HSP90 family protein n=1 Tax=Streptomyces sp. AD55 TaxID=3242895 RepID=UPI0035275067